jgi:hypothetical protein
LFGLVRFGLFWISHPSDSQSDSRLKNQTQPPFHSHTQPPVKTMKNQNSKPIFLVF